MIFFNEHRNQEYLHNFCFEKIVVRHICIGVAQLFLRSLSPLGITEGSYGVGKNRLSVVEVINVTVCAVPVTLETRSIMTVLVVTVTVVTVTVVTVTVVTVTV